MKKYKNFDEMFNDNDYVSEEDREIINLEVKLIGKMIEAREKQGLTQRDLAKTSGVYQSVIDRIESLRSTPQLDTLLKVLIPLGYSLEIIPLQKEN